MISADEDQLHDLVLGGGCNVEDRALRLRARGGGVPDDAAAAGTAFASASERPQKARPPKARPPKARPPEPRRLGLSSVEQVVVATQVEQRPTAEVALAHRGGRLGLGRGLSSRPWPREVPRTSDASDIAQRFDAEAYVAEVEERPPTAAATSPARDRARAWKARWPRTCAAGRAGQPHRRGRRASRRRPPSRPNQSSSGLGDRLLGLGRVTALGLGLRRLVRALDGRRGGLTVATVSDPGLPGRRSRRPRPAWRPAST